MNEAEKNILLKILREAESTAIEAEDYACAWEIEKVIYTVELTDTKK